jgi:hypothetical protein
MPSSYRALCHQVKMSTCRQECMQYPDHLDPILAYASLPVMDLIFRHHRIKRPRRWAPRHFTRWIRQPVALLKRTRTPLVEATHSCLLRVLAPSASQVCICVCPVTHVRPRTPRATMNDLATAGRLLRLNLTIITSPTIGGHRCLRRLARGCPTERRGHPTTAMSTTPQRTSSIPRR